MSAHVARERVILERSKGSGAFEVPMTHEIFRCAQDDWLIGLGDLNQTRITRRNYDVGAESSRPRGG